MGEGGPWHFEARVGKVLFSFCYFVQSFTTSTLWWFSWVFIEVDSHQTRLIPGSP